MYHGWQKQPNALTVEEILAGSMSIILQEKVELTGAGRTDTSVHASYFIAHFTSEHSDLHCRDKVLYQINALLPADIHVQRIFLMPDDAHARFDALSRSYEYHIATEKNPFLLDFCYYFFVPLDINRMNEACAILLKHSDFTSFSKMHSDVKTHNCTIYAAQWIRRDNQLVFTITADRFLRNMVRAIVGTMIDIGSEKKTIRDFEKIILAKDRSLAGTSVPAKGLILTDIAYPQSYRLKDPA